MEALTIGQVARRAEIGIETVRFYERRGLIENPPRTESGYRQYPEDVVSRLRFIRRSKGLGFSLKEITELLELRLDPEATCGDIKKRTESKIADIEQRIRSLQEMKKALTNLAASCSESGSVRECSILETLYPEKEQ